MFKTTYFAILIVSVTTFDSGEYYHDHFIPFHSQEEDYYLGKAIKPKTNYKCFGYHNYPILNLYPIKPKKAPPAPFLDELDTLYVPKARDRFYDTFDDDVDVDFSSEVPVRKKIPFDVCYEACPSPKQEKMVCGSDGKTYTNIHKLNCAVKCGIDVRFKSMGDCYTGKTRSDDIFGSSFEYNSASEEY